MREGLGACPPLPRVLPAPKPFAAGNHNGTNHRNAGGMEVSSHFGGQLAQNSPRDAVI
jgi:hypothetical protein